MRGAVDIPDLATAASKHLELAMALGSKELSYWTANELDNVMFSCMTTLGRVVI
jgi:hypothetical protein